MSNLRRYAGAINVTLAASEERNFTLYNTKEEGAAAPANSLNTQMAYVLTGKYNAAQNNAGTFEFNEGGLYRSYGIIDTDGNYQQEVGGFYNGTSNLDFFGLGMTQNIVLQMIATATLPLSVIFQWDLVIANVQLPDALTPPP